MQIAENQFIVNNSPKRINDLLLRAILRCMPLERMRPVSAMKVNALLRMGIWFIKVPLDVEVEVTSASPMVTLIKARGLKGIVWLNQKCTFILKPNGEEKTEVSCLMESEGMGILLRIFFLPAVKSFARNTFNNVEERLKQWS
jgi:hypothetical protein